MVVRLRGRRQEEDMEGRLHQAEARQAMAVEDEVAGE